MEIIIPKIKNNPIALAQRDLILLQIQNQINEKRKFLLENQKKIRKTVKENIFLEGVMRDYQKYHSYIIDQKRQQVQALNMLNQYIQDLTVSGTLSKNNLIDARKEQRHILNEINFVQKDLERLISENS